MLHLDPTEQSCYAKRQCLVYCCWKEITLNLLPPHLMESLIPVAHTVTNPPAVQESWVSSLGQEDPLEKRMASTPLFLPGESHGQRSLMGYSLQLAVFL